jgi:hypothetical protein
MMRLLRWLVAGCVGYLVIAVLTTALLEGLLGGRAILASGVGVLLVGSLGSLAAGVLGGMVAGLFDRHAARMHAFSIVPFLTLDTAFITVREIGAEAGWFKVLIGAGPIFSVVAGGCGRLRAVRGWSGARRLHPIGFRPRTAAVWRNRHDR